jgi:TetR/AcrR family transcriptional regulator, mexJK operon transcriptional repressor
LTSKPLNAKQKMKRKKILEEATQLFSFKGFDDTTIAQIANASGISFGSIFTYFESKEALFEAVISEPLQEIKELFSQFTTHPDITQDQLEKTVEIHITYFAKNRMYLQLIQQVLGQPDRFQSLFHQLDKMGDYMRSDIKSLVAKGQQQSLLEENEIGVVAVGYIGLLMGVRLFLTDPDDAEIWMALKPLALKILGLKVM